MMDKWVYKLSILVDQQIGGSFKDVIVSLIAHLKIFLFCDMLD